MVKIHCDKCGKEIKDKYYTINIYGHDVDPAPSIDLTGYASTYSNSGESLLRMLNAAPMYCKNCVDSVERFIKKG